MEIAILLGLIIIAYAQDRNNRAANLRHEDVMEALENISDRLGISESDI